MYIHIQTPKEYILFRFFSVIVYYKILNIIICAVQ